MGGDVIRPSLQSLSHLFGDKGIRYIADTLSHRRKVVVGHDDDISQQADA